MSSIIEPKILKGFRDFLPEKEALRKKTINILEKSFENGGFVPIDTPVLEYAEILLGKGGGETDKQLYRFTDNGGRDVALRFDLTVPFARYMALNLNGLYLPFKRYHIAKVWRGENTQKGRYREFIQCDCDIVGTDSISADFEILAVMASSIKALGINDFKIHFSSRNLFNAFLKKENCFGCHVEILRAVDKIKKTGSEDVKKSLSELVSAETAARILDFITMEQSSRKSFEKAAAMAEDSEAAARLEGIISLIEETGLADNFVLDPSITRGLDYYTGLVFETFLDRLPGIGSICSGGRYNDLANLYTKEILPGVGASIGLDRLMAALEELDSTDSRTASCCVLIISMDEKHNAFYHKTAMKLRAAGISAEVYPSAKKIKNQFAYAEKKGISFAVIAGDTETASGTVNIRNMTSREETAAVPVNELEKVLLKML